MSNRTTDEIKARRSDLTTLETDVLTRVGEIMSRTDQWAAADVYRDGLGEVFCASRNLKIANRRKAC